MSSILKMVMMISWITETYLAVSYATPTRKMKNQKINMFLFSFFQVRHYTCATEQTHVDDEAESKQKEFGSRPRSLCPGMLQLQKPFGERKPFFLFCCFCLYIGVEISSWSCKKLPLCEIVFAHSVMRVLKLTMVIPQPCLYVGTL